MSRASLTSATLAVALLLAGGPARASHDIMLDQKRTVGGVTFFPKYKDPRTFYYLPDKPRIARGQNGKPIFGFLLFVKNVASDEADFVEEGIGRAVAEGFLNFAVELAVDEDTLRQAALELGRVVPGAQVAGPITYESGQVFVVSTLEDEENTKISRVVGAGKAPVMEGHRTAVGLRLTAEGATILRESLKQGAGQLTVKFDMNVVGLRDSCDAQLSGDYATIAANEAMAVGLRTPVLGIDVQRTVKKLRTDRAYTMEIKGDCSNHQQAMSNAEGHVARMLFEVESDPQVLQTLQTDSNLYSNFDRASRFQREEQERVRRANREERERERQDRAEARQAEHLPILDMLPLEDRQGEGGEGGGAAAQPSGGTGGSRSPRSGGSGDQEVRPAEQQAEPTFSLLAAYRQKSFERSGTFNFNWKESTYDTQNLPFDFVPGGLGRLLDDPDHYLVVNWEDPAYRQRQVLVDLDGLDSADFGRFVNHVLFRLTKKHRDGEITQREIRFDKRSFNSLEENTARLVYGNHGDRNDERWLTFEYETVWSLFGGAEWRSGPQTTADFALNLPPPHRTRSLQIIADPARFQEQGVRLATVNLHFDLFGARRSEQVELPARGDSPSYSALVEWAHPADEPPRFEYEILWMMEDGEIRRSGRRVGGEFPTLPIDIVSTSASGD